MIPLPRDFNRVAKLQIHDYLTNTKPPPPRLILISQHSTIPPDWSNELSQKGYKSRWLGIYNELTVIEYSRR